ncbi:hypothetical protein STEG23_021935, partial [Scotinomys teguina]
IKDKKNPEGDKDTDCSFFIYTEHGNMKNDYFSGNLDKHYLSIANIVPVSSHLLCGENTGNIKFVNPSGDLVNMNQKTKEDTEYDIFYITNFKHFGLKVKIGKFSGHFPNDQLLYISDKMIEWATDFRQIPPSECSKPCSPGHRKSHQEGKAVCCFDCNPCPENKISNMTKNKEQDSPRDNHQTRNYQVGTVKANLSLSFSCKGFSKAFTLVFKLISVLNIMIVNKLCTIDITSIP